jgi:hypothetical protein
MANSFGNAQQPMMRHYGSRGLDVQVKLGLFAK